MHGFKLHQIDIRRLLMELIDHLDLSKTAEKYTNESDIEEHEDDE